MRRITTRAWFWIMIAATVAMLAAPPGTTSVTDVRPDVLAVGDVVVTGDLDPRQQSQVAWAIQRFR